MKTFFSIFIMFIVCSSSFAAEKTILSDKEISELLIGKWQISMIDNNVKIDAVDEFLPDGSMKQKGVLTVSNNKINIEMKSTWKVENGILTSTLLSITPKDMLPVGLTTSDTVISIDKEKFVYMDSETGERDTYHRVK